MKIKPRHSFLTLALLALSTFYFQLSTAQAQGRLNTNGSQVNGSYYLTFGCLTPTPAAAISPDR